MLGIAADRIFHRNGTRFPLSLLAGEMTPRDRMVIDEALLIRRT